MAVRAKRALSHISRGRALIKEAARGAVIVLIYLFMAQTAGTGTWHFAALLGTYGRHLSPFAAIGLNDFIN